MSYYFEWPKEILDLMKDADKRKEEDSFDVEEFVVKVKAAYDRLPYNQRVDVLVPVSAGFLKPNPIRKEPNSAYGLSNRSGDVEQKSKTYFYFDYDWDTSEDGSEAGMFDAEWYVGDMFDRVGPPNGSFLCPVEEGRVYSAEERAVPYYIPEKSIQQSPSYHMYEIINVVEGVTLQKGKIARFKNPIGNDLSGGGIQARFVSKEKGSPLQFIVITQLVSGKDERGINIMREISTKKKGEGL